MPKIWLQLGFGIAVILVSQVLVFMIGRRLPFSAYFSPSEDTLFSQWAKIKSSSIQAVADMQAWKADARPRPDDLLFASPMGKRLCVGVVTTAASGHGSKDQKLTQAIGALLSRIPKSYESQVNIEIYSRDFPHEEAQYLGRLLQLQIIPRLGLDASLEELNAYSYTLKSLHDKQCDYGLLMTEEALAATYWAYDVLELTRELGLNPKLAAIRLFAAYNKMHWNVFYGGDYLLLGFLATILLTLALILGGYFFTADSFGLISVVILVVLWVNFAICLILVNKQNIDIKRTPFHPRDPKSTPIAVLYPRDRLLDMYQLIDSYVVEARYQKDPGTYDYARLLTELSKRLTERKAEPHPLMVVKPSIFQNLEAADFRNASPSSDINRMVFSWDYKDMDRPIEFDKADSSTR